jgi:hypothetical protein
VSSPSGGGGGRLSTLLGPWEVKGLDYDMVQGLGERSKVRVRVRLTFLVTRRCYPWCVEHQGAAPNLCVWCVEHLLAAPNHRLS